LAISTLLASARGASAEQHRHLGLCLEILLRGENTRSPRIAKHITFGNADARFMRAKIIGAHELHGVRRHRGQSLCGRELERTSRQEIDGRITIALHFDVVAPGKRRAPGARQAARLGCVVVRKRLPHVAECGTGEADQTFGARRVEPGHVDLGPPAALIDAISA
jgi:hypothetical protein